MRFGPLILCFLLLAGCGEGQKQVKTEPRVTPKEMVWINGGSFQMGDDEGNPDEKPAHEVEVSGFYMDVHEVTNDQFAEFVKATGYKTVAERHLDPADFPGAPKELLKPGALVFSIAKGWQYVPGAQWRHPEGPDSNLEGKGDHPVVQVAWDDAMAYAKWAGKELPTEAQWEFAARAGTQSKHIWGDALYDDEKPQANIWQGAFPKTNDNTDGFLTTSPVQSFAPNGNSLYDMAGNVWEWCADWYRPDSYEGAAKENPRGPDSSLDPNEPETPMRVVRGGSFLCAECYCRGYRPSARMKSSPDTGLIHTGFRCVINPKEKP